MQQAPSQRTNKQILNVRHKQRMLSLLLVFVIIFVMTACDDKGTNEDPNAPDRDNTPSVLSTEHPGSDVFNGSNCKVDYSNASKGYIMAQYNGGNDKVKFQLTSGSDTYNYDLSTNGTWEAFPLSAGSGEYTVGIFENISGDQYKQAMKEVFKADIENEFEPFLHPNQYVNFTEKTKAVSLSQEVCAGAKSDLGAVEKIFIYTTENITYDYDEAKSVQPGYLPDIDETLDTGKGICFDYAAVMSAMLRVQQIPSKLVIGYADDAYHAWISVYLEDHGWVDAIEIKDNDWSFMDPTFASSGDDSDPNKGDGANYQPNYFY